MPVKNIVKSVILLAFSLISISAVRAQSEPLFVRLWEGKKQETVDRFSFHRFVSQVLVPTTVTANPNSLQAYIVIIPPNDRAIPAGVVVQTAPFDEAALVVHKTEKTYKNARTDNAWYGPLHMLDKGGFDASKSFSGEPRFFSTPHDISEEVGSVEFATPETRVAYDLQESSLRNPDWQVGSVLVSVILRKKDVSDAEYKAEVAAYMTAVQTVLGESIDGHYVRVNENHVTEVIRFPKSGFWSVRKTLDKISREHSRTMNFNYMRQLANPVRHGKVEISLGTVVNVQFPRPYIRNAGCGFWLRAAWDKAHFTVDRILAATQ